MHIVHVSFLAIFKKTQHGFAGPYLLAIFHKTLVQTFPKGYSTNLHGCATRCLRCFLDIVQHYLVVMLHQGAIETQ